MVFGRAILWAIAWQIWRPTTEAEPDVLTANKHVRDISCEA